MVACRRTNSNFQMCEMRVVYCDIDAPRNKGRAGDDPPSTQTSTRASHCGRHNLLYFTKQKQTSVVINRIMQIRKESSHLILS